MTAKMVPSEEIKFAAKTGFLSKAIWREFFSSGGDRWQRMSWRLLADRKYFQRHGSRRAPDVLILNPKNVDVRRLVGDNFSSPPYLAQIDHDEILARSVLSLSQSELVSGFRTESELKRMVPMRPGVRAQEDQEKYPDALIDLKSGPRVALELELTLKSRKRYRQMFRNYRLRKEASQIVFIVRSAATFQSITRAMQDSLFSGCPVGFVWLHEWINSPLTARIDFKSFATSIEKLADQKVA